MNLTTQAAQDILGKIERDPAEVRHWRQLLILCFDQKSIDTLQTLQVLVAGIEQIWNHKRQLAKEAHESARQKQRSTGSKEALPSLAVLTIQLSVRQKETLVKLARDPQSSALLYRFGLYLEEDFGLPQPAYTLYERALTLGPDDEALETKIIEAIKRLNARLREDAPQQAPPTPKLGAVLSPETMGVKSPSHHRPSAAALFKRTGRLSVDRSRIQIDANLLTEAAWPETQKKLSEMMSRLLARTAELCETVPRPMRLPRSIAPSQWLEFLEGHVTLLLATLEAQDVVIRTSVNLEDAPRHDVAARTALVMAMLQEIELDLAAHQPPVKTSPGKPSPQPSIARLEDIFEWIEAGRLTEAEEHLRQLESETQPKEQLSEVWFQLGLAFQNNHESKRAMVAYQQARELNPKNLQAWFNSGMIQQEEGMLHPALTCYLAALDVDPQQPKIWCNLGALQFQLGEFEESVNSLNRSVTLKPDYARAWDNLAGSLCALDLLDEAERCCHRALNYKPDYPDPYFKLGAIYFQQDRLEDAERVFHKVLETQPGYPLAGYYLAMVLARTHHLGQALEACAMAAAPPGETELPSIAWNEIAFHLYEQGEFAEAIQAYEKALAFTPEQAVLWLDAGVAHHQLSELDQARRYYEQALELDPELARAWHSLAIARKEIGDMKGAEEARAEAERLLAR